MANPHLRELGTVTVIKRVGRNVVLRDVPVAQAVKSRLEVSGGESAIRGAFAELAGMSHLPTK